MALLCSEEQFEVNNGHEGSRAAVMPEAEGWEKLRK